MTDSTDIAKRKLLLQRASEIAAKALKSPLLPQHKVVAVGGTVLLHVLDTFFPELTTQLAKAIPSPDEPKDMGDAKRVEEKESP